jgi:short-subunit dehydrogenase
MDSLQNRFALITGAASGIGQQLAYTLAGEGCHLCLVDRDEAGLQELANELRGTPVRVCLQVCDLQDPDAISRMVTNALEVTGGIDLLINNAGVACYGPTHQMSMEQWNQVMQINLLAPIQLTQQLLPHLLLRRDPHIVNMCSISGLVAGGRFAAYHTSKFGLIGFTEALRGEYRRQGVGVTAICPGPVRTQLYREASSSRADGKVPEPPAWVCASPEQVARRTLKAIRRNERQVLITPMAHLLFQIKRFFPSLIDMANGFSRRGRKRRLQQVEAMGSQQTVNPLAAAEDQPQRKSA